MRRLLGAALVGMLLCSPALADDKSKNLCLSKAMDRHSKNYMSIIGNMRTLPSPEQQVLKRRNDEVFCLESNACFVSSNYGEEKSLVLSVMFKKCLEDIDK